MPRLDGGPTILLWSHQQQCWEHPWPIVCWFQFLGETRVEGSRPSQHQAFHKADPTLSQQFFFSFWPFQGQWHYVAGSLVETLDEQWMRFRERHHEAWCTLVWTGPTSFWVDAFGVRCLLWCPGILSFATFIWALVAAKYVKPNGPGLFYLLL